MYNDFGSRAFKPRIVVSAPLSERLSQFCDSSAIKGELNERSVALFSKSHPLSRVPRRRVLLQDKVIERLLESACPSIKYRVRREVLDESIPGNETKVFQEQILQDQAVQSIVNSQQADGWLGKEFHGYDSLEAGIRLLCEKGVAPENPVLSSALVTLETMTDRIVAEMAKVGRVLDEEGFGGTSMIRATTFAYAGIEDKTLVQEQMEVALEGFQAVLTIESLDEIVEPYKSKLVFKPGVKWPSIYHLRLLAFTHSWRTPKTQELVTKAVKRLLELSPIPPVNVRHKSQLISPASFAMQDFNPVVASMNAAEWMMWFHRMEMLSRLGVVGSIPGLRRQVDALREILDAGGGCFTKRLAHNYFRRWGAYTGLMLEPDWRVAQRRVFDLTFRCLLIQCHLERT